MAILKTAAAQADIDDGGSTQEAAKELGVTFGCGKGVCGACVVEIIEGLENLSDKSDNEENFDMRNTDRMMCQSSITSGSVMIKG